MQLQKRRIDAASLITLALTVILFGLALVEKGLTHDLLLEAGVFLVSVKLVLSSLQAEIRGKSIERKLDRVISELARRE